MKKLSFRIRKSYFDAIVKGEKTVEYRRNSCFWRIRVGNLLSNPETTFPITISLNYLSFKVDAIGVFLCGKRIHRRKILSVALMKTPEDFSDQGKKDVDTKTCFAFYLGAALNDVKRCDCICGCKNIVENPMESCCNLCNDGWCEGQ